MMWLVLFALLIVLSIGGIIYLLSRIRRFQFIQKIAARSKLLSWLVTLLPLAAVGSLYFINIFAVIVALIHLFFIWVLCDFIAWIYRKCAKKQRTRNIEGACAIVLTAAVLCMGWYLAHHVYETDYRFETNKPLPDGHLRVAMLADSHLSITLSGADFAAQIERIKATKPDMLVIVGDYIDDDTDAQDMYDATAALGTVDFPVYFVLGNHDKGYYQSRSFSIDEVCDALEQQGVIILEDEAATFAEGVDIVGRLDRSFPSRADISALTGALDSGSYKIVLDHQPNDYANEAASGADLVLSGHTHGGHIFPAGQIGLLMGANDRIYGTETRGDTTFLVTSGISGWAIPFKTGTISEYVIIDIVEVGA